MAFLSPTAPLWWSMFDRAVASACEGLSVPGRDVTVDASFDDRLVAVRSVSAKRGLGALRGEAWLVAQAVAPAWRLADQPVDLAIVAGGLAVHAADDLVRSVGAGAARKAWEAATR